jgi:NADH-quinone oxidoreductase subunit I
MLEGLITTLKAMFRKPVTIQYPEQKRALRGRFKGRHILHRYENGLENSFPGGPGQCAGDCGCGAVRRRLMVCYAEC